MAVLSELLDLEELIFEVNEASWMVEIHSPELKCFLVVSVEHPEHIKLVCEVKAGDFGCLGVVRHHKPLDAGVVKGTIQPNRVLEARGCNVWPQNLCVPTWIELQGAQEALAWLAIFAINI